jgi:hypothetical protein
LNLEPGTKTPLPWVLAAALLSGCAATPFPITPIQVIDGTWPQPAVTTASVERPYTIKGDTFTLPAYSLSVNRASQANWEFESRPTGVVITYRHEAEEPRPNFLVQIIDLPAGTDIAAAVTADKQTLEAGGATITATARTVSGLQSEQWIIEQKDPGSGIEITTMRIYSVISEGRLALIQAQASKGNFVKIRADFDKMVDSIVLTGAQAPAQETETAAS